MDKYEVAMATASRVGGRCSSVSVGWLPDMLADGPSRLLLLVVEGRVQEVLVMS